MAGREEHARGSQRYGAFPAEWGLPPGHPQSEERARWVRARVIEHRAANPQKRHAAALMRHMAGAPVFPGDDAGAAHVRRLRDLHMLRAEPPA